MHYLFIVLLIMASAFLGEDASAGQKIYRTVDENGNPVFTDIPPRDAEDRKTEIDVNPANTYQSGSARPVYEPGETAASDAEEESYYQILDVTSPSNNGNLRDNAGNVHIQGFLQPNLRTGHHLRLVFDGLMTELEADGLQFNLSNVDRGSHQVQLVVVNGQGSHLKSSQTTAFNLQRYAPSPGPKAPPKAQ